MPEQTLAHWGIKGMRWGVRRYQNKDGSLTPAGKKRYSDDPDLQGVDSAKLKLNAAKRDANKASNRYNNVPTNSNWQKYKDASKKLETARFEYNKTKLKYDTKNEVSRIRDKNIQFGKKSKHRLRLEEQYKKMGMSDEEAQAAANNRIHTERIVAASAAVAVSACAAYVIRNKIKDQTDGLIKAGDSLQRVKINPGDKIHDITYASTGDHDNKRYAGMLGMVRKNDTGRAYLMKMQASSDIKVASKDKAASIFAKLYETDADFRKAVEPYTESHFSGVNKVANTSKLKGRNLRKMYENFNSNLPFIREGGTGSEKKFFSALQKSGYGAIQDVNDMKFSGYNAKNPLIIFNNPSANLMVKSVSEITGNVNRAGTREYLKAAGEGVAKNFIEVAGPVSAVGLIAAAVNTYRSDPNDKVGNKKNRRVG